ncbi:hypothetical protein L6164_013487 [Bauhinia variegata]|uniref:Uncharacterized protein n=1 Tax=Bauhinia variegata TaxID=167791 RepID=A0ACB9NF42_BAUVA|nr:hypothetical protein L6164_013487 [Bauhinia variegata]
MTASKSLSLIFIIRFLLLTTFSVPSTHSRSPSQNDVALIRAICKRTPDYYVCVHSLRSDPTSSHADVRGLAQIMVQVMKGRANDAMQKIIQLLQKGTDPKQKKALSSCADDYKAILEADVPMAIEALEKGDPKFAEDGANDAALEANSCEENFAGKSPITPYNEIMHDVAAVAAAIVRNLL